MGISVIDLVEDLLRKYDINGIVHFAAESHVDRSILGPAAFIKTNIMGTFSMLEAARKVWLTEKTCWVRIRCVFTIFPRMKYMAHLLPDDPAFEENTPYAPNSPYAASKASSDHLVRSYHHTYGLPVTLTNCSNNYGPYQFPEKLIPLMILNACRANPCRFMGMESKSGTGCMWMITVKRSGRCCRRQNRGKLQYRWG